MNVRKIVVDFLTKNGYDGLCDSEIECGCLTSDLCPCGGSMNDCQPAYRVPGVGSTDFDFQMTTKKPE